MVTIEFGVLLTSQLVGPSWIQKGWGWGVRLWLFYHHFSSIPRSSKRTPSLVLPPQHLSISFSHTRVTCKSPYYLLTCCILRCFVCIVVSCVYCCSFLVCIVVILCVFVVLCVYCCFTLYAGLLARSQYSEGPATGHLDTGFSWFPCVYKQMLRWFPKFQVATTCFSCSSPDLNLLVTNFIFCIHVK